MELALWSKHYKPNTAKFTKHPRGYVTLMRKTKITKFLFDSFNRANADALGTADTGQTWIILPGMSTPKGLYIRSNRAVALQSGYQFSVINSTISDMHLTVTLVEKKSYGGLVFRAIDWSKNFTCWYGGAYAQYHIYEVGGAGLIGVSAILPADGDLIEMICVGTSLKLYINSVLALDLTRSFNQTQTLHGIISVDGAGTKYDDFGVEKP